MTRRARTQDSKPASPAMPAAPPPARPVPPQSLSLAPADLTGLEIFHNSRDLRRDLHVFVDYVRTREIKRSVRGNALPRPDAARLARLVSDPDAADEVKEEGRSVWLDSIDHLALKLGFVTYDTKGSYAGYSSSEPSFPDNYMRINTEAYEQFLASPLARQESRLLNALVDEYQRGEYDHSYNEFYYTGILGRLDPFDMWGAATGVMPSLNFAEIRRFLLGVLAACPAGVWHSTASLVAYLKTHYPFFLIPRNPRPDRWGKPAARYGNFYEAVGSRWNRTAAVADDAPDGFERVEGRYVERFLENIPLTLNYVDVAYADPERKDLFPSRNCLRAFRVHPRLAAAVRGQVAEPKVTVQPNFEIYVESEFYPAGVLARLAPLTDVTSEDVVTILKLRREKVAARCAQDESLDVAALLRQLNRRDLPINVARELREWSAHSDKFTLYRGFGLLEALEDQPRADPFTVEQISPTLRIVRSPAELHTQLEQAEQVPLLVWHSDRAFQPLPPGAHTIFRRAGPALAAPAEKPSLRVQREVTITLHFPAEEPLEAFRKALMEARISVEVDRAVRTITYARRYEPQISAVMEAMSQAYALQLQDLE